MYLPLIFFILSLVGIIVMIGRKLVVVRNGQTLVVEHSHPFIPDLQKMKHLTFKGAKKLSFIIIFIVLKSFIKSSNFVKTKSKLLYQILKNKFKKNKPLEETEKKEVSKYLRVISEYRYKIRQMKHRIKADEGIE